MTEPNFVRVRHPDVEAEGLLAVDALPYFPGWTPVDSDVHVPSLADGTIEHVLETVGHDAALAATALAAEQASPKPRITLVERLTHITENKEN